MSDQRETFWRRAVNYPWSQKIRETIYNTPIEVAIGALLAGTLFGGTAYHVLAKRAGQIPLAFSEISRTTRDLGFEDKKVPPLTRFYSVTNDVTMMVFESNNIAYEMSTRHSTFAHELETKMDRDMRVHTLIPEYSKEIAHDADEAMRSLRKLLEAIIELPDVIREFDAAWTEHHRDVTHTKRWTTRSCDSERKNCRTVRHSKEVYDYTIHTFTYFPEPGEKADRLLKTFLQRHPDLNIDEQLLLATSTQADNEYAIGKSMKRRLKGKLPSAEQYLAFANTWATGSNLTKYLPVITENHTGLVQVSPAWERAKKTATSVTKRTTSRSDSGPKEFQIAETSEAQGEAIYTSARKIIDGIKFAREKIPALDAKIREYIGVALDHKKGNANKLRKEVMQLAQDIYQANFESGLDVQPFKWTDVFAFMVLGIVAGGLAGAGVDRILDRNHRYSSGTRHSFSSASVISQQFSDVASHAYKAMPDMRNTRINIRPHSSHHRS